MIRVLAICCLILTGCNADPSLLQHGERIALLEKQLADRDSAIRNLRDQLAESKRRLDVIGNTLKLVTDHDNDLGHQVATLENTIKWLVTAVNSNTGLTSKLRQDLDRVIQQLKPVEEIKVYDIRSRVQRRRRLTTIDFSRLPPTALWSLWSNN
jgi:uncharacterized coiled-coil protein SlyX